MGLSLSLVTEGCARHNAVFHLSQEPSVHGPRGDASSSYYYYYEYYYPQKVLHALFCPPGDCGWGRRGRGGGAKGCKLLWRSLTHQHVESIKTCQGEQTICSPLIKKTLSYSIFSYVNHEASGPLGNAMAGIHLDHQFHRVKSITSLHLHRNYFAHCLYTVCIQPKVFINVYNESVVCRHL